MIKSFKSRALKSFYDTGSKKSIQPKHEKKLKLILANLEAADKIVDIDFPSFRLHPLKHEGPDVWSLRVDENFRVTFRFVSGDIFDVDYLDYHE